jgi:transmembrane sensor
MDRSDKTSREALNQAAAEWVVRLASESCADPDRVAFEAWLRADPHHEVAYLRAEAASDKMNRLRALRAPGPADPDILAKPGSIRWSALPDPPALEAKTGPDMTRRAAAGLLVAVLAGGAYVAMGRNSRAYATAVGQQMSIPLSQGGRLQLNTDSRVQLAARSAHLIRGEALFTIGQGRVDPFTVRAGEHEVQSSAGVFDLRSDARALRLLVMEGEVRLRSRSGPQAQRLNMALPAGSAVALGAGAPTVRHETLDELTRSLSWRFGAISLAGEPLWEAVDEFNRYNDSKMAVSDPALRDLRVGGYFQANDPVAFAKAVELTFGVRAVARDGVLTFVAG